MKAAVSSYFLPVVFCDHVPLRIVVPTMETSPAKNRGKRTYYFGVRVNWDKLLAIDQQKESFKAQIFFEASLLYPKEVDKDDEDAVVTFFHRASVENSLAKRKDDEFPTRTGKAWKFAWLIYGEFGEELELKYFPFDTQDLSVMLRFGWHLEHPHPLVILKFVS